MPEKIKILSFADRLKQYGLSPKDVLANTLRVTKQKPVYLSSSNKNAPFAPKILRAKGIDDVKRWIGVPDHIVMNNRKMVASRRLQKMPRRLLSSSLALLEKLDEKKQKDKGAVKVEFTELVRKNSEALRQVTNSYIYGLSAEVAEWRQLLDKVMVNFPVMVWAFNSVVVEKGAALNLDERNGVLVGDKLIIERGGTINISEAVYLSFAELKRTT